MSNTLVAKRSSCRSLPKLADEPASLLLPSKSSADNADALTPLVPSWDNDAAALVAVENFQRYLAERLLRGTSEELPIALLDYDAAF